MRARSITLLLLLLASTQLSGCWDRTEINDMAFILSSAVDLEPDGNYRLTVLVPLPGQMGGPSGGGGGTSNEKSYYIDSEVGKTYGECLFKLQHRVSRRMFLAHRRTLLVGEELAKHGIRDFFEATPRSPENRMSTYMIVTKGKAYDMLNSTPKFEHFPSEAIRELIKSKYLMDINFRDIGISLSLPGADPVAVYMDVKESKKGIDVSKEVELKGYAQFRQDKMVATLEDDTALGLNLIFGKKMLTESITLNVGDGQLMFARIYETITKINTKLVDQQPQYQIIVKVKAKLVEDTSIYDLSKTQNIAKIESEISEYAKKAIKKLIDQSIKNHADSSQLGTALWRAHPDEWRAKFEKTWPEGLKDAKIDIQVQSQLSDTGLIYDNVTRERSNP